MKMKYYLFVYIFLLTACVGKSTKLSTFICNDSIKYWDYNMIRGKQNVWFTFSFDKNGVVKKYSFYKNNRWLFSDYGYYKEFAWSVSEDSIINFMGTSEKILRVQGDTLFTKNVYNNEYSKFIHVKDSLNIQKY